MFRGGSEGRGIFNYSTVMRLWYFQLPEHASEIIKSTWIHHTLE